MYCAAPEVLSGMKHANSDVWSAGVILHIMLVGFPPFRANNPLDLATKIKHEQLTFDTPEWAVVSPSARKLVQNMLMKDPSERVSAKEAQNNNSWLLNLGPDSEKNEFKLPKKK